MGGDRQSPELQNEEAQGRWWCQPSALRACDFQAAALGTLRVGSEELWRQSALGYPTGSLSLLSSQMKWLNYSCYLVFPP